MSRPGYVDAIKRVLRFENLVQLVWFATRHAFRRGNRQLTGTLIENAEGQHAA